MVEDKAGVNRFIEYFTYGKRCKWYKRRSDTTVPPNVVNVDISPEDGYIETINTVLKVKDQPDLWEYQGEVPLLIRSSSGFNLLMRELTQQVAGDFNGTISNDYEIGYDDRIIDADEKEYKVLSVSKSQSETFKRLQLKYLP